MFAKLSLLISSGSLPSQTSAKQNKTFESLFVFRSFYQNIQRYFEFHASVISKFNS